MYADLRLHLAQFAQEQGIRLDSSTPGYAVRCLIVAGEPGGSIPATRARIEEGWHARVFDHSGMTEIGPLAIECPANRGGLHIMEDDYYAEVIDPVTGNPLTPTPLPRRGEGRRCPTPLPRRGEGRRCPTPLPRRGEGRKQLSANWC